MSARNGMPDSHSPPYAFIVKEIEIININDIKTMRERPENLTFLHPMLEFKEGIPYCFSGFKDINRSYICNGYLEGCDILHDLYKISPSFIINKQGNIKPGGSKIIISQDLSSAKYTELIKYLSTDDNKFKSPFIKIEGGDAINASGLSKSFSQDIGRYIKEEFMYDFIEKKLCTLPLQSGGASAPANTPSNNKSKIKTDIDLSPKNFIISKLTDDVIPGLSNVLAYYAFTYNRLNYDKFRASLGINFSSFTIMMLFNIFSERTKISLSEVFNILLGFVDLFELTDQDRDESYDSTKFLEKKLSTNPNKTEDIMRLFKIIDRYIGIFYAINGFIWMCASTNSILFFISALAETNRPPFDLPEAEAELVAGYQTEYSGMMYALFWLGEYANILLLCGLGSVLFLGGWLSPIDAYPFNAIPAPLWLIFKILFLFSNGFSA